MGSAITPPPCLKWHSLFLHFSSCPCMSLNEDHIPMMILKHTQNNWVFLGFWGRSVWKTQNNWFFWVFWVLVSGTCSTSDIQYATEHKLKRRLENKDASETHKIIVFFCFWGQSMWKTHNIILCFWFFGFWHHELVLHQISNTRKSTTTVPKPKKPKKPNYFVCFSHWLTPKTQKTQLFCVF